MKTGNLILAKRYAKALDRIAKNTGEAASNLAMLEDCVKGLQEFSVYIENPTINGKVKEDLIKKFFPKNIASAFLLVLIKEKRFALIGEILKEMHLLLDERQGIKRAQVTSAKELSAESKEQIQKALENYFKTKLTLSFKEDVNLISGLKIKAGDFFIEDSAHSRLRELENVLRE